MSSILALILATTLAVVSPYGSFDVHPKDPGPLPYNVDYATVTDRFGPIMMQGHSTQFPANTWHQFREGDWLFYNGTLYQVGEILFFEYELPLNPYGGRLEHKGDYISWEDAADIIRTYSDEALILHTCISPQNLALGFRLVVFNPVQYSGE